MLGGADRDIKEVIAFFTEKGVDATYLVPTATGFGKSIMDATASVRIFLKEHLIHDYEAQEKGQDAKKIIPAFIITEEGLRQTTASLYRPETKNGDPRIWIHKLKEHSSPWNLLALLTDGDSLYVINTSQHQIMNTSLSRDSPLSQLLYKLKRQSESISDELLLKLRDIASLGYIPSQKVGDTAVGHLTETLLGISQNSNKAPDYKGIELKSGRVRKTRKSLFAQVPDWDISALKSSREIVETYGYDRYGQRRLYCSVSSITPNSQGLYFAVDSTADYLREKYSAPNGVPIDVVA